MPLQEGIYEQLITKIVSNKIQHLEGDSFYINSVVLDKHEASRYLGQYLAETINYVLNAIKGDDEVREQPRNISCG